MLYLRKFCCSLTFYQRLSLIFYLEFVINMNILPFHKKLSIDIENSQIIGLQLMNCPTCFKSQIFFSFVHKKFLTFVNTIQIRLFYKSFILNRKMNNGSGPEIDFNELKRLLNQAAGSLEKAKGKNLVLVIGKTGAGKSTLINYLRGCNFKLLEDDETGDLILERETNKTEFDFAKTSSGQTSCTLHPSIYFLNQKLLICDTAGFGDSRSLTQDIFTYLAVQMAIKSAKSIKAVIAVVEQNQLTTERGAAFKSIAQVISSLFKSCGFYKSFFLFINKGDKKVKQIQKKMKIMEKEMRQEAQKEKNPLISQGYRQIEAVLSIFGNTKNVYRFQPSNPDLRQQLIGAINNSPLIGSDHFSISGDSKNMQSLKKILCNIDSIGSLKNIQTNINLLKKIINDIKTQQENIEKWELEIKNLQTKVQQANEKIDIEQKQIQKNTSNKERETLNVDRLKKNISEQENIMSDNEKNIEKIEQQIKSGKGIISDKNKLLASKTQALQIQKTIITSLKISIQNFYRIISQKEKELVNLNNKLAQKQKELTYKQSIINSSYQLDKQSEISTILNVLKGLSNNLASKQFYMNKINYETKYLKEHLNKLENDTELVCIHSDSYSENTVYGTLKKGIVYTRKFDYSGSCPISKVVKDGETSHCSQGSDGYFSNFNQGAKYANVTYNGPSHCYGWAKFQVYAEKRYSQEGINNIYIKKKEIASKQRQQTNAKIDYQSQKVRHQQTSRELDEKRKIVKNRINSEIAYIKNEVQNLKNSLYNCISIISSNKSLIQNSENNLLNARTQVSSITKQIQDLKNQAKGAQTTVIYLESSLKTYRNNINSANSLISSLKDSVGNSQKLIVGYNGNIQKSQSSINSSKQSIDSLEKSTQNFNSNIEQSKNRIQELIDEFQLKKNIVQQEQTNLKNMEQRNEFNMLKTIYRIMELNLKLVEDFPNLYKNLPNLEKEYKDRVEQSKQLINCFTGKQTTPSHNISKDDC